MLETAARARRQVDLEVCEFRSSESDWRASARISHCKAQLNYLSGPDELKPLAHKKIEELDRATECPSRFYHPYLERYDNLCCPVFQVVTF